MKNTIELHKRWKDDPSKGEVFTPIELVKEMLDKIPTSVWENPTSTFLDPCMGKGTFLVEIVNRLVYIYGYSKEDAISRVYGYDIRVKYVNYLKRAGLDNVFHNDFLKEEFNMKFDVIVGNPPYQDSNKPGDNALYQFFTKKVLDGLLKDGGYFTYVLPTTMCDYLLLCDKNRTFVNNFYDIKYMVFDYPEKYFKQIGIGTTAFYFLIRNEIIKDDKQNIQITYDNNGKKEIINRVVKKGEVLPKKNFQKYDELASTFLSDDSFNFKVMSTTSGKYRRIRKKQIDDGTITTTPNEDNVYPIIDKITKTNGNQVYFFNEMMNDYNVKKVIFSKSGYPMATYMDTPVNLSDNMMYVEVKNEIEGINLAKIINSEIFSEVIKLFSTNARDAHKTICKLKKVNLTEFLINDEQEMIRVFRK